MKSWLKSAGTLARTERMLRLPRASRESSVIRRSRDWAEVRPEWGLAGCKAFVAAPRSRTQGVSLDGRAFLHDYVWAQDKGFKVLELIMTAPVVVASWISLQYYGSTVSPETFGGGSKLLHNVTGGMGVVEGNGGALRVGLPMQSIHDGERFMHEPVRLSVCIEAPREAMAGHLEAASERSGSIRQPLAHSLRDERRRARHMALRRGSAVDRGWRAGGVGSRSDAGRQLNPTAHRPIQDQPAGRQLLPGGTNRSPPARISHDAGSPNAPFPSRCPGVGIDPHPARGCRTVSQARTSLLNGQGFNGATAPCAQSLMAVGSAHDALRNYQCKGHRDRMSGYPSRPVLFRSSLRARGCRDLAPPQLTAIILSAMKGLTPDGVRPFAARPKSA